MLNINEYVDTSRQMLLNNQEHRLNLLNISQEYCL